MSSSNEPKIHLQQFEAVLDRLLDVATENGELKAVSDALRQRIRGESARIESTSVTSNGAPMQPSLFSQLASGDTSTNSATLVQLPSQTQTRLRVTVPLSADCGEWNQTDYDIWAQHFNVRDAIVQVRTHAHSYSPTMAMSALRNAGAYSVLPIHSEWSAKDEAKEAALNKARKLGEVAVLSTVGGAALAGTTDWMESVAQHCWDLMRACRTNTPGLAKDALWNLGLRPTASGSIQNMVEAAFKGYPIVEVASHDRAEKARAVLGYDQHVLSNESPPDIDPAVETYDANGHVEVQSEAMGPHDILHKVKEMHRINGHKVLTDADLGDQQAETQQRPETKMEDKS